MFEGECGFLVHTVGELTSVQPAFRNQCYSGVFMYNGINIGMMADRIDAIVVLFR